MDPLLLWYPLTIHHNPANLPPEVCAMTRPLPGRGCSLLMLFFIVLLLPPAVGAADKKVSHGRPPALVATAEVEAGRLRMPQLLVGSSEPLRQADVAAETQGLVSEIVARQGDRVAAGAVLVRLRDTRQQLLRDEARARLAEAGSRLRKAEADARRAEDLFKRKFISDQELQARLTDRDALLRQQDQLRAAIRLIEDRLSRMVIRAPFAGQVVAEKTELGQWLAEGEAALTLVDLSTIKVMVPVPEQRIAGVQPGATLQVSFDALPGETFSGRIAAIIPRADRQARTFPVQVNVANPEGRILAGMLARVRLDTGGEREVLLVPKDALVSRPDGSGYVVRVVDGKAALVPVRVLSGQGERFAVDPLGGGLAVGDRVVVRGNERLRPGQVVREAGGRQG
ncbi:hypothetical protein B5V00_03820 [Geothermobacter hydrogeniphilus]|uniref:Uncharacterized protein n=2 Tax=Geothermobacter hydrogeniphilus TaxID=1969733 RepID=A0A1X0YBD8_9BACT|nr:hypothetical protein B5V00_03820 [Geothermobacter hydrogeniphilus]